jgi:hypothetical protein
MTDFEQQQAEIQHFFPCCCFFSVFLPDGLFQYLSFTTATPNP